jgi:hypothetical protein
MPEEKDNDLLDINFNVGSDEPNISTEDPGDGLLDINFDVATEEEKEEPKKAPVTPIAKRRRAGTLFSIGITFSRIWIGFSIKRR